MSVEVRPVTAVATSRQSRASQIIAAAPRLQQFADERYSRQVQGDIKRGPQVLNLYNECAFRGAANLRLLVPEAEEAAPGLEPLQSGTLLHEALRRVWRQLGGSDGLALIPDRETNSFVAGLVADLVSEQLRKAENSSSPRRTALAVEERRLVDRITALLAQERQRTGFVAERLEESLSMTVGGVSFRMRVDRIDRVQGEFLLIDYKSGRSGLPSWRESPPREIQLLIYREALLAQNIRPQGLVSWHLLAKEIDAGGAVSSAFALPKALMPGKALTDWEAVGRQWSELIQQIANRLWQGDAELRPLKNACDFCDLVSLCRRDERLGVEAHEGDDRNSRDNAG
jgi:ATP-dependent helicase/nuclease subunit B